MATETSRILKITVGLILFIKQIKRNLLGIFDIYLLRLTRFNSIWLKKWNKRNLEMIIRISLQSFSVIDEAGEDDNPQNEEENKQGQFFSRCFECMHQYFETGRVPSQFEQPQDSNNREKFQNIGIVHVMSYFLRMINKFHIFYFILLRFFFA